MEDPREDGGGDDAPRKVDKRKSVEKSWRKGEPRWSYDGDGDSDSDFLKRKRSAPRLYQIVRPENERDALVVQTGGPTVVILDGELEFRARPRRSTTTANPNATLIALGDRVRYIDSGNGEAVITHVYPRHAVLLRRAIGQREDAHVIVANIDLVIVVSAATRELLRPGLIDRYLIATRMGGLEGMICLNKMDLVDEEDMAIVEDIAEMYRAVGYAVVYTSCITGEGIPALRSIVKDAICAFSGHSGVGKTSLLNHLVPDAREKTQELSAQSRRGIHTTSTSRLFELPSGGFIADTPGIREFGLHFFDRNDLHSYYPEFLPFADRCRFPSCTHVHEPGCAVRQAVEDGEIHPVRYRNYLQILESESGS